MMTQEEVQFAFKEQQKRHLVLSLVVDAIGVFTFALPLLGEIGDLIWAPISGISIFVMYRLRPGSAVLGGFTGFVEEILPGTDFVPTATLLWAYHYYARRDSTLQKFVQSKMKDHQVIQQTLYPQYQEKKPGLLKRMWSSIISVFYEAPQKHHEELPYQEPLPELPEEDWEELPDLKEKKALKQGRNPYDDSDFV